MTFVLAAKCLITDVHILHVEALQRLLGALIRMSAEDIVALEVSWMPDESVFLSKAALTKLFPRMTKLPSPTAGQRICAHCKGQHTTESTNCPHSTGRVGSSTSPLAPRTAQSRIEAVRALRARGPKSL